MIKRLNDLRLEDNKAYRRIAERQRKGTMSYLVDKDGYICYDTEELKRWKPKKAGRKPKFRCEICGEMTPKEFEGGEPNVCEDCVPLTEEQLIQRIKSPLENELGGNKTMFDFERELTNGEMVNVSYDEDKDILATAITEYLFEGDVSELQNEYEVINKILDDSGCGVYKALYQDYRDQYQDVLDERYE